MPLSTSPTPASCAAVDGRLVLEGGRTEFLPVCAGSSSSRSARGCQCGRLLLILHPSPLSIINIINNIIILLLHLLLDRLEHGLAKRTRGTALREPREDALGVERVLARQYPHALPGTVLVEAYRARAVMEGGQGIVVLVVVLGEGVAESASGGRVVVAFATDFLVGEGSGIVVVEARFARLLLVVLVGVRHVGLVPELQAARAPATIGGGLGGRAVLHRGQRLHLLHGEQPEAVAPPARIIISITTVVITGAAINGTVRTQEEQIVLVHHAPISAPIVIISVERGVQK
mmetsp:Transcript_2623/g.6533  ORF Transcript_2623/g.6533 Transcript_2623/m.6533 type:complete len:289 (+) Transcript_2623:433-1299(+)